jgi:hypothetical protein
MGMKILMMPIYLEQKDRFIFFYLESKGGIKWEAHQFILQLQAELI